MSYKTIEPHEAAALGILNAVLAFWAKAEHPKERFRVTHQKIDFHAVTWRPDMLRLTGYCFVNGGRVRFDLDRIETLSEVGCASVGCVKIAEPGWSNLSCHNVFLMMPDDLSDEWRVKCMLADVGDNPPNETAQRLVELSSAHLAATAA